MTRLTFNQSEPKRLDRFVSETYPSLSRSYIAKQIEKGLIKVNKLLVKPSHRLRSGNRIDLILPKTAKAKDIDLPIIYEDDFCLVIDKPSGILTHAKGSTLDEPTLASFIKPLLEPDLEGNRAGIVHRLDRGTSGLVIAAKNSAALKYLQRQFAKRQAIKTYIAVVNGNLEHDEAMINFPIERNPKKPATFRVGNNGKPAETYYKVMQTNSKYSLIELQPKTGRTHQLRVHLQAINHPIVGDNLYGGEPADRLMLHAFKLSVILPDKGRVEFKSNTPTTLTNLLK